ncbi:Rid family detoxifying hydrolase [Granulicatella seriolae]|uniref:Rid family detoxifying hydrolase n=1 Tax=Granulicatella seriolae TaxID=2967226 RepID=A0ABT1WPQ0_9LACT|nr:Rid family detoxifying hydrolase [Granulicatella seriolae]
MKRLDSAKAPQAVGPYSQALVTGDLVFLSGQVGIDRQTGQLQNGLEEQTHQVFRNISYVLEEEGLTLKDVVKTLVLLSDIQDYATVNGIYAQYFEEPYPARSAFAVAALPLGAKVEIEVVARIAR